MSNSRRASGERIRPGSRTSTATVASNTSLGIGDATGARELDPSFIKLRPSVGDVSGVGSSASDSLVFVILCMAHDRVAVSEVAPQLFWFPFVTRGPRISWKKASVDGLTALLESKHADGTVLRRAPNPVDYRVYQGELIRLQDVQHRWSTRVVEVVVLNKCDRTCEPVNSLVWLAVAELKTRLRKCFWGPEVEFVDEQRLVALRQQTTVTERPIDHIEQQICAQSCAEDFGSLMQLCAVTQEMVWDFYEEYSAHCWPALAITQASWEFLVRKLGYKTTDKDLVKAIFKASLHRPKRISKLTYYADFLDVCYAALMMDPKMPNEFRVRFLFDLYDLNHRGVVAGQNLDRLVADNGGKIHFTGQLSWHDFQRSIESGKLCGLAAVARLSRSVFFSLGATKTGGSGGVHSSAVEVVKVRSMVKSKRTRYLCGTCRRKKYQYGQHCTIIDTAGRAVDHMIIQEGNDPIGSTVRDLSGPQLYSMECSFSTSSVGTVFFDYIRNGKFRQAEQAATGPNAPPQVIEQQQASQAAFVDQFKQLCEMVALLVRQEPKVAKRQSPAVVVGDVQGSLESVLSLERQLWRAMPVQADDLVFLGNYTGNGGTSGGRCLEVLGYLFALKYLSPCKVLLLRGIQETRAYNEPTLLPELRARYGDAEARSLWDKINSVFDHLPYIAVVNETVVCISSGIPKDACNTRLGQLLDNVSSDCATLHQVLTNMPDRATEFQANSILFRPIQVVPNAFQFSQGAFRRFLDLNHYTYLIRSNEWLCEGFDVCFGGKCISIESNSVATPGDAASNRKQGAVATICHPEGRIRIVQMHN